jgi:plasmid segregation protein ParM
MQAIGIDIGYGNVKVNTGERSFSFPSIVGNYQESVSIGFDRNVLECVEIDGEKFLIGESAKRHSSRHFTSRSRDWIETIHYKALLKHALVKCGVSGAAVITTGLPVDFMGDKERLAAIVKDVASKVEVNASVHVLPQPVGAFFSLLFDEKGSVLEAQLASSRVGILDIGYFTTDLLTIASLTVVEKQLASFENGVSTALEAIRQDLADTFKLQLDIRRTEEAVRRGKVTVFGEERDITAMCGKWLRELEGEIQAHAQTIWGNAADLDRVILSGGGAAMLSPYLNLYRHATVIRNAADANAAGFHRNSFRRARV